MSKWKSKVKIINEIKVLEAAYRPFNKVNIAWCDELIHRKGQFKELFSSGNENLLICLKGVGDKDFSCLITNTITDLQVIFNDQCFPLYWYEEKKSSTQQNIFAMSTEPQQKNISVTMALPITFCMKQEKSTGLTLLRKRIYSIMFTVSCTAKNIASNLLQI